MPSRSISQLADHALLQSFAEMVRKDLGTTAELVAHIAEIDLRKLYLPAGCPSMYEYCVRVWGMSEDMAYKRIRVARAARRFPALLQALADGRLHLAGIVLLAPHLTRGNVDELLAGSTHRRRAEIELLIAERFPRRDVPTSIVPVVERVHAQCGDATPAQVVPTQTAVSHEGMGQLAPGPVVPSQHALPGTSMVPVMQQGAEVSSPLEPPSLASTSPTAAAPASGAPPAQVSPTQAAGPLPAPVSLTTATTRARLAPLSPGRYALQVTVDQETFELLQQAKELLGHALPSGDTAELLKRALGALVSKAMKRKFGSTDSPRARTSHANGRYVPAEIRRQVCRRDQGRCMFVGTGGRRCESRMRLELDHEIPVARGGRTCVENLRLRCQAHNQYGAEQAFGAGFMKARRERGSRPGVH